MPSGPTTQLPNTRPGSAHKTSNGNPSKPGHGLMHVLLAPVRSTKKLFTSKIRLQRRGLNLHVVLEDPAAAAPRNEAALQGANQLSGMREALKAVLDENPDNRHVLRHLAHFEAAFKRKGLRALKDLPSDVLQKSLDQFEMLVSNWSHEGLSTLRSKMSLELIERGQAAALRRSGQAPSDFHVDHKMTVEETSVSRFMAIHEDWQQAKTPA